jgi:hypothetical protein
MAHDLSADLDQTFAKAGQGPVRDLGRQSQGAQEVAEVVGERVELEPDGVGAERVARQPRPADGVLALFRSTVPRCPGDCRSRTRARRAR